MASGGIIGGFTGQLWHATRPRFDGLAVAPTLAGVIVGALLLELLCRPFLRPRQV
jgi:hypothetical protein